MLPVLKVFQELFSTGVGTWGGGGSGQSHPLCHHCHHTEGLEASAATPHSDPLLPTKLHCLALWLSPHGSHPVPLPAPAAGWGLWPVLVSIGGKKIILPVKARALSSPGGGRRVRHGGGGLSPLPRCFPGGMSRAERAGAAAACPPQEHGTARRGGCSAEGETPGPVHCARCAVQGVQDAPCPVQDA